jgi:cytochrome P450
MQSSPETALDPTGIRRNIAGIIVGAVETTSECVANVIDFFLDEPELLMRATAVAREGSLEEFRGYVFEALRFNPQASLLIRIARTESVLARGTARETRVAKNTAVLVGLLSAMFDPEELDAPEEFNPARPARHYLHFGDGLHQCFGRHINALQLPIIVRAILRLPDLRRAGAIELDGPFPNRLLVNFKPPHT